MTMLQHNLNRLGKLFHVVQSKRLLKAFLFFRVLAGSEHRNILKKTRPMTVVDVGANRGQFTLATRKWAPQAMIVSFEPLDEAVVTFQRIFRSDPKVTIHKTAIGFKNGETTIHVSAADDSSSLLPISFLQERLFPGTGEVRQEKVKIGPLTDYLDVGQIVSPALLKIDVQGYELEVLRGCEALLPRFYYVYVECSFLELYIGQPFVDDIIAWLRERGFALSGVYNMVYDRQGNSVQADFLFRNTSAA